MEQGQCEEMAMGMDTGEVRAVEGKMRRLLIQPTPTDSFRTLIALRHALYNNGEGVAAKSKKQYERFVMSLLDLLLEDKPTREMFLDAGGDVRIWYDENHKVVRLEER